MKTRPFVFRFRCDDLINKAVLNGLLCGHEVIALRILADLFLRLTRTLCEDGVEALLRLKNTLLAGKKAIYK